MKLFQAQVQLAKQADMDLHPEYWLHAVTFCDQSHFVAAGHGPLPNAINEHGEIEIDLFITRDIEMPDLNFLTPVVHTIYLGRIEGEFLLIANVKEITRGNDNPGGNSSVSSGSANEKEKPIRSLEEQTSDDA